MLWELVQSGFITYFKDGWEYRRYASIPATIQQLVKITSPPARKTTLAMKQPHRLCRGLLKAV
eukprot:scaffold2422_cov56-Attheya_sp.AAC.3